MFHDYRHAWNRVKYENEGNLDPVRDGHHDAYAKANNELARRIWYVLQQHYPGHPWKVATNLKQGIAQIELPTFTSWSFVINLKDLKGDPAMRVVMRGAGEFLERYGIPRSGFDVAHYLSAVQKHMPVFNMNRLAS